MRVRTSYLVEDLSNVEHTHSDDKTAIILEGVNARKHIRVVLPEGQHLPFPAEISWSKTLQLDAPFDAPLKKGLHINTATNSISELEELREYMRSLGAEIETSQYITAPQWDAYFSESNNTEPLNINHLGIPDGYDSVRIIFGYIDSAYPNQKTTDVVIEAWYPNQPWNDRLEMTSEMVKHEIGFLAIESDKQSVDDKVVFGFVYDLSSGELTPKRIMYNYEPVYRKAAASMELAFAEPYGLHPELELKLHFDEDKEYEYDGCKLFAELELPSSVFADQFQLMDLPAMSSPGELMGLWGETDLEAPIWHVEQGSLALIKLDSDSSRYVTKNMSWKIPLHFRYENPTESGQTYHTMPEPHIYFACEHKTLPQTHLRGMGMENVFPDETTFHYVNTNSFEYTLPAITTGHNDLVALTTMVSVIMGTIAIILTILWRLLYPTSQPTKKKQE